MRVIESNYYWRPTSLYINRYLVRIKTTATTTILIEHIFAFEKTRRKNTMDKNNKTRIVCKPPKPNGTRIYGNNDLELNTTNVMLVLSPTIHDVSDCETKRNCNRLKAKNSFDISFDRDFGMCFTIIITACVTNCLVTMAWMLEGHWRISATVDFFIHLCTCTFYFFWRKNFQVLRISLFHQVEKQVNRRTTLVWYLG